MPDDQTLVLYGAETGNSLRAAIALEESGLPFSVRKVALAAGEHRTEAFRRLNPLGKVPVLLDRRTSSDGFVVTQSNAIMLHVSDAVPGVLTPAEIGMARTRFYERLYYFVTDVIAPGHAAFALRRLAQDESSSALSEISKRAVEDAERFLQTDPFMAGDDFSLVDIIGFTIAKSVGTQIDWSNRPLLQDWYERVASRPGVARGLKAFS